MVKMKIYFFIILLFLALNNQVHAAMILHESIAPGLREMIGARDSLPSYLKNKQCVIACYTKIYNQIVIAGYYATKGFYNGRICWPNGFSGDISPITSIYSNICNEGSLPNCRNHECWAGGDTGGFYRYVRR